MVIWCPDWPVITAERVLGIPAHQPVAVLHDNRVLVCSPAARAEGVRRGLRRREAQGRCPRLRLVDYDAGRDTLAYQPVLAAIGQHVAGIEVLRPGVCAVGARGPTRYFGGEAAAAEHLIEQIAVNCDVEAQIGIADGIFAAGLAARAGRLIEPGQTAGFLAGLDVSVLDRPVLVDLLRRLGVRTLGDFVGLPAADVLTRFGFDAALAHRLAGGRGDRPLAPVSPPADLAVTEEFEEPVTRIDAAAFAARALAERLHTRLAGHTLACTRLVIEAQTSHGDWLERTWRHDGLLAAAAIADRVRWQLDGWLGAAQRFTTLDRAAFLGRVPAPPASGEADGIVTLRLVPEGLVTHLGLQAGLWGEPGPERDRAHRALTRVQGLLGPEAVTTAVLTGGRGQADQVRLVPFGDELTTTRSPAARQAPAAGSTFPGSAGPAEPIRRAGAAGPPPWPGHLPAPSPATFHHDRPPVQVCAADGAPVQVSGRLVVSAPPARVAVDGADPVDVAAWAGPWPVDERWWAPVEAQRYARFQVLLADGRALLLRLSMGCWSLEASYD